MEIPTDDDTMWWVLKAGRGGVLEDDWLDRRIVSTGWGNDGGDFRSVDSKEFRESDPSPQYQLSKFVGCHKKGMKEGDVVIAYAPEKGHISGVGEVGEPGYDEELSWRYLSDEEAEEAKVDDQYYWRPITWFDLGTPVRVADVPKRFQVNGSDQIPTPMTLNRFGTLAEDRDRIETLVQKINSCETVDTSGGGFGPEQEAQIQDWIVDNIRTLDLYNPRREVRTSVGRIDVLAESDNGESVIEVKRGRAGDKALGQLLGYMGARAQESSVTVSGVLVAESFTSRVQKATSAMENVELFEFGVSTSLTPV